MKADQLGITEQDIYAEDARLEGESIQRELEEELKETKPAKVVVVVDGGSVQLVYASDPHISVVVVDHDNLREDHNREEREAIEARAVAGLFDMDADEPEDSLSRHK